MKFRLEFDARTTPWGPKVNNDTWSSHDDFLKIIKRINVCHRIVIYRNSRLGKVMLWGLLKQRISLLKWRLSLFKHRSYHLTNWGRNEIFSLIEHIMRNILSEQKVANFICEMITVPRYHIVSVKWKSILDIMQKFNKEFLRNFSCSQMLNFLWNTKRCRSFWSTANSTSKEVFCTIDDDSAMPYTFNRSF